MSNLPKETIDKIKADAKTYMHNEIKGMVGDDELQPHHLQYAHEAGATEWAGKAQPVIDTLEQIQNSPTPYNTTEMEIWIEIARNLAATALAKYKEVANER